MTKNALRGLAALVILLAVFSVIAFALPLEKSASFWIAYLCGVLAILLQIYFFRSAFGGKGEAKSKFYGFPVARVGVIYLAVQLGVSIAEMALAKFHPLWAVLIVNALILAAALLGCLTVEVAREEVVRQDTGLQVNTSHMRELQAVSGMLADQCSDPELKLTLKKLAEELRYSDPVTSEKTETLENRMREELEALQSSLQKGSTEEGKALCGRLMASLQERNRLCSLHKS